MTSQAALAFRGRNPDVLTCIANLSNDEVFTPPELASQMLDMVAKAWAESHDGASIWADPTVRFLDPFTKSGVFLREITKRLVEGLAAQIPDLQARVDHILTKQVFGIAITELTALLARRTLYCSKWATGPNSIATAFSRPDGNIWFERMEHTWAGDRCAFCGASKGVLDRGEELESHAYAFIHTDDIQARIAELFGENMQFDVIIGNPPYQLDDGGQGASAVPIYNKFIEQAKVLQPRLMTMVVPSRWLFGGRGLDAFRKAMLEDGRLRRLVDFHDSRHAFDGVDVAGGVCYFLWDRDYIGHCEVIAQDARGNRSVSTRSLLETGTDVFVRDNVGLGVLRKVVKTETGTEGASLPGHLRFESQVSGQKPFGLRTFFRGHPTKQSPTDLFVLQSGGSGWISRDEVVDGIKHVDRWKVFTSKSSSEHAGQADRNGMRRVLSKSGVLPPGSVFTETYVLIGSFDSEAMARNCLSYACSKFFRYLVSVRTSAQDLPRVAYAFVPQQDYSKPWSDGELYEKYQLSNEEIQAIEVSIRPMDAADE